MHGSVAKGPRDAPERCTPRRERRARMQNPDRPAGCRRYRGRPHMSRRIAATLLITEGQGPDLRVFLCERAPELRLNRCWAPMVIIEPYGSRSSIDTGVPLIVFTLFTM